MAGLQSVLVSGDSHSAEHQDPPTLVIRNNFSVTEHAREAELVACKENAASDASGIKATEHTIVKWQEMFWYKSEDCYHLILVLLSLRASVLINLG